MSDNNNITESFIPALNELHKADPLELIEKLTKLNLALLNCGPMEIVAAWNALDAAKTLYNFNEKQLVIINNLTTSLKNRASFIRDNSDKYGYTKGLFWHILNY